MSILIDEIRSVAVVVSNEKKAKRWYTKKLGLKVQDEQSHWIVVGPKGSKFGLHLCRTRPLERGNTGILFLSEDPERTYRELKRRGIKFTRPYGPAEWDPNDKYGMFKDPDGNEFWLMPKAH